MAWLTVLFVLFWPPVLRFHAVNDRGIAQGCRAQPRRGEPYIMLCGTVYTVCSLLPYLLFPAEGNYGTVLEYMNGERQIAVID